MSGGHSQAEGEALVRLALVCDLQQAPGFGMALLVLPGRVLRNCKQLSSPGVFIIALLTLSFAIFIRPRQSNFIFDEQEALLKNPFLRSETGALGAWSVDFWGRSPETTIGSYRPLPNALWKLMAQGFGVDTPFWFSLLNLVAHATTALLLSQFVAKVLSSESSIRREQGAESLSFRRAERVGRVTGLLFVCHGVLSEAVCSCVGLADILVALLTLVGLRLLQLCLRASKPSSALAWSCALSASMLLGLWSKESMLGSILAFPILALVLLGPTRRSTLRVILSVLLSLVSAVVAVVLYVELRKACFPTPKTELPYLLGQTPLRSVILNFFTWFGAPPLPYSQLNNPLESAPPDLLLPTVLGLLSAQLKQVALPLDLRGDYSFPAELPHDWDASSAWALVILGGFCCSALWASCRIHRQHQHCQNSGPSQLLLIGVVLFVFSYLPVSNAVVLLPTIRAERLLYLPVLALFIFAAGGSLVVWPHLRARLGIDARFAAVFIAGLALALALCGRAHANIYDSDLRFWSASYKRQHPSAKSALNLAIMLGARGDLRERERLTHKAIELSPDWEMAHVYLGDVLCLQNRLSLARKSYLRGLALKPNSKALTALALQCIWDKGAYLSFRDDLYDIAEGAEEGSWLAYFLYELDETGAENRGLAQKYRAEGYNRAPRGL